VQTASHVRWRDNDAVRFALVVGVGFVNLVVFPEFLPFGFCGKGFVKTREIRNSYGHAGNGKFVRILLNFATGLRNVYILC
jgi:predicted amidohydrolase